MENLKKLASKIVEKQGISHEKLKPRKGEIKELRKYLPTAGFKLITTYRSIYNPFTRKAQEILQNRSYQIIKL